MRKFLSLIFALFVTLPFCTKCYAIEVDSLGDEVRHVVRQSVPANIEILDGSIQSGAAGDLEYLDQKVVFLKSGVSDAGKNCVRLEVLFTGVPKTRIQSATFRLGTVNAGSLTYTISLFDWNSNSYIEHNSTGAISSKGLNEINLINWSDCHIDDSANIKVEVTISAESPFELSLDQMQLLLLCEESVQNVEVRNYTVENAQIEQGTTVAGTTAKNLKDRDGASFQVKSSNKKAAWTTTVPLYYEKNDVQTIQVDYTGNTSEETNVIWLSLYRFDTQNWEVVGTIPGSTEEVTRSFVLSGNGILGLLRMLDANLNTTGTPNDGNQLENKLSALNEELDDLVSQRASRSITMDDFLSKSTEINNEIINVEGLLQSSIQEQRPKARLDMHSIEAALSDDASFPDGKIEPGFLDRYANRIVKSNNRYIWMLQLMNVQQIMPIQSERQPIAMVTYKSGVPYDIEQEQIGKQDKESAGPDCATICRPQDFFLNMSRTKRKRKLVEWLESCQKNQVSVLDEKIPLLSFAVDFVTAYEYQKARGIKIHPGLWKDMRVDIFLVKKEN